MRRTSVQRVLGMALPLVLLIVLILLLQAVQGNDVSILAQQQSLTITKTDSADPAPSGGTLTYTLDIISTRNQATANVVVTDTLDANVTLVTSRTTSVNFACSQNGASVVCSLPSMAANSQEAISLSVSISASFTGTLTNQATVNSDDTGPDSDTEVTDVRAVADLGITKVATLDPATAGEVLTYVLTVTNDGPTGATGIVLTDTLPGGVVYRSSPTHGASCSQGTGIVACALGSMATGSSQRVELLVDVNSDATGTLLNWAEVSGDVIDENTGNDRTADVVTPVIAQADVEIGKRGDPSTVVAGDALTYTLGVNNLGPSNAQGVIVTDTLPLEVNYHTHQASQGTFDPASGLWSVGTVAPTAPATLTLVVDVNPSYTGVLTNSARVGSQTVDPNPDTNVVTATTTVEAEADLELAKGDEPDPVVAGTALTYTLILTNGGPSAATGVVLTDTLPQGLALDSHTASQGTFSPTTGIWHVGEMAPDSSATLVLETLVDPGTRGTLENGAEVGSQVTDPDLNTNVVTEMTAVEAEADLEIAKSDNPDPVAAGTALTYTLVITNHGPSHATGVRLTDTLPLSVTFGSAIPGETSGPRPLVWNLPDLARGMSETVTVIVTPDPWISTTLTNTVEVAATEHDPGPHPNTDREATTVRPLCEVLQVTDTPAGVVNVWPSIGGLGAETRVAYLSDRSGREELFVATLATPMQTRQATTSTVGTTHESPSISGDGRRVAFVSDGDFDPDKENVDGSAEVFVYDTRFEAFQNVTGNPGSVFPGFVLGASPDDSGARLTYASDYDYTGQNADANLEVWLHDSANGPFRQVDGGWSHTCGLRGDGSAECWGYDGYGQATAPAGPFSQISTGEYHTCGLRGTGSLLCWGYNGYDQAPGAPVGLYRQVSAGAYHTCAVQDSGDVVCWGYNYYGQASPPPGSGSFTQVSAGGYHTCGLSTGGGTLCWGYNYYGQLSPPLGSGPFVSLSAGRYHTCGLQANGAVVCWGYNYYGQASVPPGSGSFTQVSAGGYHTCGLQQGGEVLCWGYNYYGQASPPTGSGAFSRVSTGDYHTCGVGDDGELACWGADWYGQASPPSGQRHMFQVTDSAQSSSAHVASSGNGEYVAFLSNADLDARGGNADRSMELFVARLAQDGFQIVQVTQTAPGVSVSQPSISHDGRRVAFLSDGDLVPATGNPEGNPEIFVAQLSAADLTGTITLTQITDSGSDITHADPMLSGDGRTIAFVSNGALDPERSNADANPEIYLAAVDRPGMFTQVTQTGGDVTNAAPSINRLGTQVAFVSDGELHPVPGNPEANQEVFVASCRFPLPTAELLVEKKGQVSTWNGATFPYSLLVTNPGQTTAYGVTITDRLVGPASLYSGNPRCEEQGSGEASCYASELAPGDTLTLTLWVRVEASSGLLTNTVEVHALNTRSTVSDQFVTSIGPAADLSVEKTTTARWVAQGETITYTVVVANDPLGSTTDVTVTDTVVASVPYLKGPASLPGGSCGPWQGDSILCTIASLVAGGTYTLTLEITPQLNGVITNSASVKGSILDPNPANNEASVRLGPPPIYLPIVLKGG